MTLQSWDAFKKPVLLSAVSSSYFPVKKLLSRNKCHESKSCASHVIGITPSGSSKLICRFLKLCNWNCLLEFFNVTTRGQISHLSISVTQFSQILYSVEILVLWPVMSLHIIVLRPLVCLSILQKFIESYFQQIELLARGLAFSAMHFERNLSLFGTW